MSPREIQLLRQELGYVRHLCLRAGGDERSSAKRRACASLAAKKLAKLLVALESAQAEAFDQ